MPIIGFNAYYMVIVIIFLQSAFRRLYAYRNRIYAVLFVQLRADINCRIAVVQQFDQFIQGFAVHALMPDCDAPPSQPWVNVGIALDFQPACAGSRRTFHGYHAAVAFHQNGNFIDLAAAVEAQFQQCADIAGAFDILQRVFVIFAAKARCIDDIQIQLCPVGGLDSDIAFWLRIGARAAVAIAFVFYKRALCFRQLRINLDRKSVV